MDFTVLTLKPHKNVFSQFIKDNIIEMNTFNYLLETLSQINIAVIT